MFYFCFFKYQVAEAKQLGKSNKYANGVEVSQNTFNNSDSQNNCFESNTSTLNINTTAQ